MRIPAIPMLLCLVLLSCSQSAQQVGRSSGLESAKSVDRSAVTELSEESRIIDEIGFLNRMWLEADGDKARKYYSDLMDRWEVCATEDSLPVLEEFIRYAAEYRKPEGYGPRAQLPWAIFGTIDVRIQELWWRLKTEGMTPEQKAELALWGLSGEWPDSPLPWTKSIQWLLGVGPSARETLYRFIEKPLLCRWDNLRAGALSHVSVGQHKDIFEPPIWRFRSSSINLKPLDISW